jgi:uncharacterized phage-associated protein
LVSREKIVLYLSPTKKKNNDHQMDYTDVLDAATFFKSKDGDKMKTMKLLYYSQALYLKLYGDPLFEEDFQAWTCGPVPPKAYHCFESLPTNVPFLHSHVQVFLQDVYDTFEDYNQAEDPWLLAFWLGQNQVISLSSMQDFFKGSEFLVEKRWKARRDEALELLKTQSGCNTQPSFEFLE